LRFAAVPNQKGAWQQTTAAAVHGARPGDHVKVDIVVNRLPIDPGRASRESAYRIERGPEYERARYDAVGERACAHPVDRQQRLTAPTVHDGAGKRAREGREYVLPAALVALRECLRSAAVTRELSEVRVGKMSTSQDRYEPIAFLKDTGVVSRGSNGTERERGVANDALVEAAELYAHGLEHQRVGDTSVFRTEPAAKPAHGLSISRARTMGALGLWRMFLQAILQRR